MTQPSSEAQAPGAWPIYRRLLGHAWIYWPFLLVAMAAMIVEALAGAAFVWLMEPLTNDGFVDPKPEMAVVLPAAIIGLFLLRGLATFVAIVMGIGAVFGAMRTMYAIVSASTREIGTLRALGFSRGAILFSLVVESVFLAVVAGALGCLLAFPMNGFSSGTGQTQSFSEIAFNFRITPGIVGVSVGFAFLMGFFGGLLPAFRGARLPITTALRAG